MLSQFLDRYVLPIRIQTRSQADLLFHVGEIYIESSDLNSLNLSYF